MRVCYNHTNTTSSSCDLFPQAAFLQDTKCNAAAAFKDTASQHSTRIKNDDVITPPDLLKEYTSLIASSIPVKSLLRALQPMLLGKAAAHETGARAGLK